MSHLNEPAQVLPGLPGQSHLGLPPCLDGFSDSLLSRRGLALVHADVVTLIPNCIHQSAGVPHHAGGQVPAPSGH
jgi:hypothetical protein